MKTSFMMKQKPFFTRGQKNIIEKYNEENPYAVTMYRDNDPELVKQRNMQEIEKMLPLLQLSENSRVLDIACGIGRWSDAITTKIEQYCGLDYCENFISKACELNKGKDNRFFFVGGCNDVNDCLKRNNHTGRFNRILLMGVLLYLNDDDIKAVFREIYEVADDHTVVLIRGPIALEERLTLKRHFSEELDDTYNAIYRTRDEMVAFMDENLFKHGFKIKEEAFLYDESLNGHKETQQYYFVLER